MILEDHIIKGSYDFICGSPLWSVTILPSLVAIGIVVVKMFLICHVILQDHVT